MATINRRVDELGGIMIGNVPVGDYATLQDAARVILADVIPGVRGVGTMSINHEGRKYTLSECWYDRAGKTLPKREWQAIEYLGDGTIGHVIDLGTL